MRTVSLACSNTEIVHALGCADLLVGVDDHSDFPVPVVSGLPRLGPDLHPDLDKVAAPQVLPVNGSAKGARVFWGHGLRDPSIPWALAERGRKKLIEAGVDLETKDYEIGHWIAPEEITAAMEFAQV